MTELVSAYSLSRVPYIEYAALDDHATSVIADFCPDALSTPMPVDIDSLLEFYLKLRVEYKQLSYDHKVLGLTAFNDGFIRVIDEQRGCTVPIYVDAGTVAIDDSLLAEKHLPRMRFTLAHEGSHWILHRRYFSPDNPFFQNNKYENQRLAAKEGRVDYSRKQRELSDNERLERQADFFAAALLMPKPALRLAFKSFFRFYGERPRPIYRGKSVEDDCYAKLLPKYIAKIFEVSEQAAIIRLEKLEAIVDDKKWAVRT